MPAAPPPEFAPPTQLVAAIRSALGWRRHGLASPVRVSGVVLAACLPSAFAATVEMQTPETDPAHQWQVNGANIESNQVIDTTDDMSGAIAIDGASNADRYWLFFTNSKGVQGNIEASIDAGFTAFSQPLNISQPQGLFLFDGVDNNSSYNSLGGPNIQAFIHLSDIVPFQFNTGPVGTNLDGPVAAFQVRSRGVLGPNQDPFGSNAGAINLQIDASLRATGNLGPGQGSLPWQAAGALVAARSIGANGGVGSSCDDYTGYCAPVPNPGGDGGNVTVSTSDTAAFSLSVADQGIVATAQAPMAGLMAVSLGGSGGMYNGKGESGPNGRAHAVNVTLGKTPIHGSTAFLMGVVAASVGGSSQPASANESDLAPAGAGGDVSVTLNGTTIALAENNAIGVVATSTANASRPTHTSQVSGSAQTFGNVSVTANAGSSITVGAPGAAAVAGTDTNIGILALSAPGWASEPFTGAAVEGVTSPGTPGNVSIALNDAAVTAHGQGAIAVLAQSIAGNGASASGGLRAFVGDQGGPGGNAGQVTLNQQSGNIATTGDGGIGTLLQAIAGGGGNGGNAAGLFVAVGGDGGSGGQGGTIQFSQSQQATISTQGDYAQGVVLQSVGGGGGNGGFAKAYSLGVPVAAGIGGRGGIGGAGGTIALGSESNATAIGQITTLGQHAHGVVAHTIGAGGGTGGAATSVDANIFTLSVAVGGSGAGAGNGGAITGLNNASATLASTVITQGHDAHGLLLQSIGGGGGAGGGATAAALSALTPDDVPTVNIGVAVGGAGGNGGDGGNVNLLAENAITTRGANAHGVLVQSLGGGGGTGADSTAGAGAFLDSASFNFNSSVSLGGAGGRGGNGGGVQVASAAAINTQGHHAVGITAQSLGGGGGVAGVGNAAAVIGAALEEASMQLDFGVGGRGGSGGTASSVTVSVPAGGSVSTAGAGAVGVLAQSVGGGGGVAGNAGAQAIGGKFSQTVAVGGAGGSGNHAGPVSIAYAGNISTGNKYQIRYTNQAGATALTTPVATGGGAHGIVAQSIGGGGGIGGNADPSATIVPDLAGAIIDDVNKVFDVKSSLLWWAKKIVDYDTEAYELPKAFSSKVAVGGSGGAAGNGNDISLSVSPGSRIMTAGHRSYAILAQSIGGGGGAAGSASGDSLLDTDIGLSPLTGFDFDLGVNVGGSGGASGTGGAITLNVNNPYHSAQDNRLMSSGHGSHLILLQSIGGGGGVGHEGSLFGVSGKLAGFSVPEVSLGAITTGTGTAADAGKIQVGDFNNSLAVIGLFETSGDDAAVLVAQSVGGGGGLAGVGCTNSGRPQGASVASACYTNASTASGSTPADKTLAPAFVNKTQTYALNITGGANGAGDDIEVSLGDSGMHTTGDRATAVVLQSISGGGGYATADRRNVASTTIVGGTPPGTPQPATVSSGNLDLYLENTEITTAGHGSWGILAQTIAGGGGLLGDTSADLLDVPNGGPAIGYQDNVYWTSGNIFITLYENSTIRTGDASSGAYPVNTHGIVAQSLGSGGGIQGGANQSETSTLALNALTDVMGYSGSINILVTPNATIDTQGIGAIGILAQIGGRADGGGQIEVSIDGAVTGGRSGLNPLSGNTLDGVGVMLAGSSFDYDRINQIMIGTTGKLTTYGGTTAGYAVRANGMTQLFNQGTVTGSVDINQGVNRPLPPVAFVNRGTFAPGPIIHLPGSRLQNHGLVQVGNGDAIVTARLVGDFEQTDTGRLTFATRSTDGNLQHSQLLVQGTATVAGSVAIQADDLLPGTLPVLQAEQLNLSATLEQPLLFRWQAQATDTALSVTPSANFRPLGLSLSPTAGSLANYLQRGWQNADASKARLFGYLSQVQVPQHYQSTLQQLGGQSLLAQPQQLVQASYDTLGDSLACPSAAEAGVRRSGERCTWARLSGSRADQSGTHSTLGYRSQGGGLRVGFQQTLSPAWRLGASAGASQNRLNADDLSSKGTTYEAAVALTHQRGALEVSGALAVARGNFRNDRTPQLGATGQALGLDTTYHSTSHTTLVGARLRTAYTFAAPTHYVKPYLDLDVIHTRSPGFTESGRGPLALEVGAVNKTQVVVSPMLEVGTQRELKSGTVVRGYVAAGASLLPNNQRTTENRLAGSPASTGSFNLTREGPKAVGRFNLGVEVQAPKQQNLSFRAEYSAQAGGKFRSQSISARMNIRF